MLHHSNDIFFRDRLPWRLGMVQADAGPSIVVHLAESSAAEGVIASFPGAPHRYPADQAVTLYAIHLHDQHRRTAWLPPALAAYHEALDAVASSGPTGLPPSELTGSHEWSAVPRGCALAWTVQYLAEVDPVYAHSIWDGLQRWMFVVVGPAAGVREWPLGEDRPADIDSGPIVLGVGAAATAFAIGTAHAMDDSVRTAQLEGTEWLVRQQGHPAADSALAVAISEASTRR